MAEPRCRFPAHQCSNVSSLPVLLFLVAANAAAAAAAAAGAIAGQDPDCSKPSPWAGLIESRMLWLGSSGGIQRDAITSYPVWYKEHWIPRHGFTHLFHHYHMLILNQTMYVRPFQLHHHEKVGIQGTHLFLRLLCQGSLPDVEFIWNSGDRGVLDHASPVRPVFSWATSDANTDALLPYWSLAWPRTALHGTWKRPLLPWSERLSKAVFRGSTTGGIHSMDSLDSKPRLRVVEQCREHPDLCDGGLIGFVQVKDAETKAELGRRFNLTSSMPMADMGKYKYIVVVDGNGPATRMPMLVFSNSLLLKQDSPVWEWFYKDLEPYQHYVPIANDASDLIEKIEWALEHDEEAEAMAARTRQYAETHLTDDMTFCYVKNLFTEYSKLMRFKPALTEEMEKWKVTLPQHLIAAARRYVGRERCAFEG